MGQPIPIGPFTFAVTSARRGHTWDSPAGGTFREIVVEVELQRDESAPFTVDFHSYASEMVIVDAAGNRIPGSAVPISPTYRGGRYRSTQYSCLFRYSRSQSGVRNFAAVGTSPADFRLEVKNPSPERDQPPRVSVQLQ